MSARPLESLLSSKKISSTDGFTLIELLVVIIIIGVLSAIALPSFLSQAAKARQTEAKTAISATNRAQQAYRIENTKFATSFEELEIGLPTATESYTYTIAAIDGDFATISTATEADDKSLKNFSGGVFVTSQGLTSTAACQTKAPSEAAAVPTLAGDEAVCPANMEPMR